MANDFSAFYESINDLISEGRTEDAIVQLKNHLQAHPTTDTTPYKSVLLLAGQYNAWEKNRLGGLEADNRELNRISSRILDLVDDLRQKRQYPSPPHRTSPDPLRVSQTYQPPTNLTPTLTNTTNWSKYLLWFLAPSACFFSSSYL
ncbi:MAG: hypothetical protein HC821_04595 [Lewinella sp.]|nr:hypothetical protein [Lewinella sp.]